MSAVQLAMGVGGGQWHVAKNGELTDLIAYPADVAAARDAVIEAARLMRLDAVSTPRRWHELNAALARLDAIRGAA